jgi:hypothetical protein
MMWKRCYSWKVYILSERDRVGIKSFVLCEANSGYIWNFIMYIRHDSVFVKSQNSEPYGIKVALQLMAPTESGMLCNNGQLIC